MAPTFGAVVATHHALGQSTAQSEKTLDTTVEQLNGDEVHRAQGTAGQLAAPKAVAGLKSSVTIVCVSLWRARNTAIYDC